MKFEVFIFSYNRGTFLQNCIESVEAYWPNAKLTIVDDNSDDEQTLEVLKRYQSNVVSPESSLQQRHGGLYRNMQYALDLSDSDSCCLFLQDDMQLVRPVRMEDEKYIHDFFDAYQNAAFLNPVFLKGARARRDKRITHLAEDFMVYFRHYPQKKNHRGLTYSDVVIAHTARLRKASWSFEEDEIINANKANGLFGRMGFMLNPFVMFLPEVPVYRGKKVSFSQRIAQWIYGDKPNGFVPLSKSGLEQLFHRSPSVLPVAEDYLQTQRPAKRPFVYSLVKKHTIFRLIEKLF
jgi:glycosyltransferase involved in cell wall biosynthesis